MESLSVLRLSLLVALINGRYSLAHHIYSAEEVVPGCSIYNNVGVLDDFAPLPGGIRDISLYSVSLSMEDQTSWGKFNFQYFQYNPLPGFQNVPGFVKVTFDDEGTAVTLDYLRVNPNMYTQLEYALLEWSPSEANDGKIRVKYLTSDCKCRMRVYDLTVERVEVEGAMTRACDGTDLPRDLAHMIPGCNRDDNPGVLGFSDSEIRRSFVFEQYSKSTTGDMNLEIDYGSYNTKQVNGNFFIMHMVIIKLGVVFLDYVKVKSCHNRYLEPFTKGYDYTKAIYFPRVNDDSNSGGNHYIHIDGQPINIGNIRPSRLRGSSIFVGKRNLYIGSKRIHLGRHDFKRGDRNLDPDEMPPDFKDGIFSLKFLMNDCTCRQRNYELVNGELHGVTTEVCDSFEGFQLYY